MRKLRELTDVDSDQQNSGLEARLVYDRQTAARLGITPQLMDTTLYSAFGQQEISTIYLPTEQSKLILEVQPRFQTQVSDLSQIYLAGSNGQVPLSAVAHYADKIEPLTINHQSQFPAVTISWWRKGIYR